MVSLFMFFVRVISDKVSLGGFLITVTELHERRKRSESEKRKAVYSHAKHGNELKK